LHSLVARAIDEESLAEIVSIVVHHQGGEAQVGLRQKELNNLWVSIVQESLEEFTSSLVDRQFNNVTSE
jgi:hypothetical protein